MDLAQADSLLKRTIDRVAGATERYPDLPPSLLSYEDWRPADRNVPYEQVPTFFPCWKYSDRPRVFALSHASLAEIRARYPVLPPLMSPPTSDCSDAMSQVSYPKLPHTVQFSGGGPHEDDDDDDEEKEDGQRTRAIQSTYRQRPRPREPNWISSWSSACFNWTKTALRWYAIHGLAVSQV